MGLNLVERSVNYTNRQFQSLHRHAIGFKRGGAFFFVSLKFYAGGQLIIGATLPTDQIRSGTVLGYTIKFDQSIKNNFNKSTTIIPKVYILIIDNSPNRHTSFCNLKIH